VDEQTIMAAVDFFPMFCKLTGAPLPNEVQFDGEDLTEALFGKSVTRRKPMFWEYGRNGAFGYPKGKDRSPNVAVRDGKWKLLVNADGANPELYDLQADRNETHNVAERNPQVAKRLLETALQWRKSLP
jgi:arylsulfatase A-like enzyme